MGREYCIHMVRIEDDCDECVTYGGPDVWETARAWQAFRDWLNGVGDRVLIEGATFKGPRPGAWLTIDPKTGAQTFDLRGATITYGGSDD